MASIEELKKRAYSMRSVSNASSEEEEEGFSSRIKKLKEKAASGAGAIKPVMSGDDVDEWFKSAQNIGQSVSNYFTDENWSKNPSYLPTTYVTAIDSYLAKEKDVEHYIRANKSMFDDYEGTLNSFYSLTDSLRSLRTGVERSNTRVDLGGQFNGITEKLNKYGTMIDSGEYLTKDQLDEYSKLAQDYVTVGGKLFTEENGYDQTAINQFQRSHPHVASNAASIYDTYSQFDNAEDWKWAYDRNTAEKRLALDSQLEADLAAEKEAIKKIEESDKSWYEKAKLKLPHEAKIAEIETEMANYERGNYNENGLYYGSKTVDEYYHITQRDDFATTSANRDYKNPTREEIDKADVMNDNSTWRWDDATGTYRDAFGNELAVDGNNTYYNPVAQQTKVADKLALYFNTPEDEREQIALDTHGYRDGILKSVMNEGYTGAWEYLTEGELGIYYTLLGESQEKAYQYLSDMDVELNRRRTLDKQGKWKTSYENSGWFGKTMMNIGTIPANVLGGASGFVEDAIDTLRGEEINPYSLSHGGIHYSNTVRGATAEDLDGIGFDWFDLADVYQSGMSMADSLFAMGIGGGGTLLAMGAAEQEALRLYESGASKSQVLWGAATAGAAEMIFESWSLGNLDKIKKMSNPTRGQFFKALLVQGGVEGSEEALTNIANTMSNAFIMGDQSDWTKLINENDGSVGGAVKDKFFEVLHDAISGAISGGVSGAIVGTPAVMAQNSAYRQAGRPIKYADGGVTALKNLAMEKAGATSEIDSKVSESLKKQADKISEKSSAKKVGMLYEATQKAGNIANASANQADIAKSLQRKLQDHGFNAETANDLAGALVAQYNGQELTKAQEKLLKSAEKSEVVKKAVNAAVENIMLNEKSTMGQRSQDIRDFANEVEVGAIAKTYGISKEEAKSVKEMADAIKDGKAIDSLATAETVYEGNYEVSKDGKASVDGKEVKLDGFKETDAGVMVATADGQTVDGGDVTYSSNGHALVYEGYLNLMDTAKNPVIANMSVDAKSKLAKAYDLAPDTNGKLYFQGANQAFWYGFEGMSLEDNSIPQNSPIRALNEEQIKIAYEEGRKAGEKSTKTQQSAIEAAHKAAEAKLGGKTAASNVAKKKGGTVILDGDIEESTMTEKAKASKQLAKKVAEAIGKNVHIYKGMQEYGKYDTTTGEIWLNINGNISGQSMMAFTLAHELVHMAKQWSPADYKAFADYLVQQYGKNGHSVEALVKLQMDNAIDNGYEMDWHAAYEEVIADACQRMLLDSDALQKMAAYRVKNPSKWQKIVDAVKKFIDNIRQVFAGAEPDSQEAAWFKEFDEAVKKNLEQKFVTMVMNASEHMTTIQNAFGKDTVVEVNADGEFTLAKGKVDGATKFLYNDSTWEGGGRDTLSAALKAEGFSQEDIDAALTIMDGKHKLVRELAKQFPEQDRINKATITTDLNDGHSVLSALVSNGDYPVNIDLLMVCKKRKAYQRVINRLCETGLIQQATVDALAIAEINKILGKYGFETACLGCFVESRRLRIQEWAETIVREWKSEVKKRNPNAKAFGFGKGEATLTEDEVMQLVGELEGHTKNDKGNLNLGQGSAVKRMGVLLDKVPSLAKTLTVEDLITPEGLTALRQYDSNLFSMVKSRYGSNSPKFVQEFNPYNHELAKYGKVPKEYESLREYLYAIGGARMQSFSDFIVENWFDYCQIVADLAARKLPMHTYTKEISLAKLFGLTGIKINMSLIPDIDRSMGKDFAGLTRNENGELELIWADKDRFKKTGGKSYMQSINFADAIALQNDPRYSGNVGTIAVGVSYNHILMMLDDARIRMIIPYHSSGMNPIFADLMGTSYYTDYTNVQNTRVKQMYNSKGQKVSLKLDKTQTGKLTSGFQFNEVLQELGDARAAANAYKEWCADASKHTITIKGETYTAELTPKFDEFAWHDNYYKLLEDFNTYDCISEEAAPQGDVQQVYPENFDEILKAELTAQESHRQKQEKNQAFDNAMGEIESFLSTHTKADTVFYAEQHGVNLKAKDKKLNAADKAKIADLRKGMKMSLPKVNPVQPSTSKWRRTLNTDEAKTRFPTLWDVSADESEVRNPTQISGTVKSYRKIYEYLKSEGFDGNILDASSGLGYGTRAGIEEYGFDVEDIEPYPDKSYSPKYTDYSALHKKYDVIISNAVLNVLPQDQRDALVIKMASLLKAGGRIFINVRGKDVDTLAGTKTNVNISPMEWFVGSTGSYQKGFTKPELVAYLEDALGNGYRVNPTSMFGAVSAVVTKVNPYEGKKLYEDREVYNYDFMIAQDSMTVATMPSLSTVKENGRVSPDKVVEIGLENAKQLGREVAEGQYAVVNAYTNREIIVGQHGLEHGLGGDDIYRLRTNARLSAIGGELVRNAIPINGLRNKNRQAAGTYAMACLVNDNDSKTVAIITVEEHTSKVVDIGYVDITHAINGRFLGKKRDSRSSTREPRHGLDEAALATAISEISIADFLEIVNMTHRSILSDSVLQELGEERPANGHYTGEALFKTPNSRGMSPRQLLANAFDTLAQTPTEREKMAEYRKNIAMVEDVQERLKKLRGRISELTKENGDKAKIAEMNKTAKGLAELIDKYDRKLLDLEASKPLKDVLTRARAAAYREARESGEKSLKEYRQQVGERIDRAIEGRRKTEMRKKIRKTIRDLDKILNRGNKKRNVKEDMKGFVESAITSAEVLFTDNYTNEDMIRNGVGVIVSPEEQRYLDEARTILAEISNLPSGSYEAMLARQEAEEKLKNQLAYRMTKLKDTFLRERIRLAEAEVSEVLGNLADEYAKLKDSEYDYVKGAFHENVHNYINHIKDDIGGTKIKDMNLSQLEAIYKVYTMVMTTVRDANKSFVAGKNVDQLVEKLVTEFGGRKMPKKKIGAIARNLANMTGWNYEKLYYALDRIGSETLTELFNNLANSENIVMADVIEAKQAQAAIVEKYGYNNWKVDQKIDKDFVDNTGKVFRLTLGELMSLYAYSRREGAWNHIEYGGFVFGKKALTEVDPVAAYKLTKEQCEEITNTLTEDQKKFAEEMQTFLSDVMGAKGNEVSMLLYGIEMFGEKNYFPIHIAGQFKANAQESQAKAEAGFSSMTNAGFTQAQNKKAKAPFVMESFMDVWSDHVNEMSRYHGTVPALEDIRKVMNYSYYSDSYQDSMSVKAIMENKFGRQAVDYFNNLYQEANSGAITDKMQKSSHKLLSKFRKNSVAYSLSVLVQQPLSMIRAFALIDKKYFSGPRGWGALPIGITKSLFNRWTKVQDKAYAEMLKYAPGVTLAKEIGGFDTASGHSIRSYLLDTDKGFAQKVKTDKHGKAIGVVKAAYNFVDDNPIANLPNVADKIAWIEIWNACKRETMATHKTLSPSSDAFMQEVGKRFTEIIRATQVYDSIFAKSPMLKSKNLAVQYLVSFMNEPNTVANMVESGARDLKNGDVRKGSRKITSVVRALVMGCVVKAVIYAMRDDDEDETFIEKYTEALAGSLLSDITIFNYIPIARDVWSVAQGYDVERPDMAIVSDAISSLNNVLANRGKDTSDMTEEELEEWDKKVTAANWKLVDSVAAFFGIPVKNIRREINAVKDHARIAHENSGKTTWNSIEDAVDQAIADASPAFARPDVESKTDKIYDAIIDGDTAYLERLKSGYVDKNGNFDQTKYDVAVRKALRENDPRIKEAAEARFNGDFDRYKELFLEVKGEGNFSFDLIMGAINTEINDLEKKSKEDTKKPAEEDAYDVMFTVDDYYDAVAGKDQASAKFIYEDLVADKIADGYLKHEAEDAIATAFTTEVGERYMDEEITRADAVQLLEDNTDKGETQVKKWDFEMEYGFSWGERVRKYRLGKISEGDLINAVMDIEGEDRASAEAYVDFLNLEKANADLDITANDAEGYFKYAEPAGIDIDVYLDYKSQVSGLQGDKDADGKTISGSKKKKVLAVIHTLPISRSQKDALYLAAGYSEKDINEAPWH